MSIPPPLRKLQYVLAVARELHFRRAAERLNVSQPYISRQIKEFEADIGFNIFRRDPVCLTPSGQELVVRISEMLSRLDADFRIAVDAARAVNQRQTKEFIIGHCACTSPQFRRQIRVVQKVRFPKLRMRFRILSVLDMFDALESGQIQVGITFAPLDQVQLLFDSLRGTFLERRNAVSDPELPKLLVDEGVLGFVRFGQALLESAHEIEGAISIADAITSVATISPQRASAVVLGMLIAVYFTTESEVRVTPLRGVSQTVLSMTLVEPYQRAAKKVRALLNADDVWLLSTPPWEGGAVSLSVTLGPKRENGSKQLESIIVNGMELLDAASARSRSLSVLFGNETAQLGDLLKVIATEFAIPEQALGTEQALESSFVWHESAGLVVQRTDFKRVVTDVELMLLEGNDND